MAGSVAVRGSWWQPCGGSWQPLKIAISLVFRAQTRKQGQIDENPASNRHQLPLGRECLTLQKHPPEGTPVGRWWISVVPIGIPTGQAINAVRTGATLRSAFPDGSHDVGVLFIAIGGSVVAPVRTSRNGEPGELRIYDVANQLLVPFGQAQRKPNPPASLDSVERH
jgi:hypothetical protein